MVKEIGIEQVISRGIKKIMTGFLAILPELPQEELNLDNLFKQAKWEEQAEVVTREYEVEKITTTAGVRGNEATDEILDYLYYRVRDNKFQIPTKLAKKLNM